jgi:hypothetical protein
LETGIALPTPARQRRCRTIGTAIATFDKNNRYGNKVDGTSHVAIYLGQDAVGIQVMDQWIGHPVSERTIYFRSAPRAVNDGSNYYVVE